MAKAYVAITKIQGGRNTPDGGVENFEFEPDAVVKGLTKDEMKALWSAGAIREVDVVEVEKEQPKDPAEGSGS
jgi:hypothetical protein